MLRRAEIRQDVIARLKGETNVGDRVFPSKATPLQDGDMPAILVYVTSNTAEQTNPEQVPTSLLFLNQLQVNLEVHAIGESDDKLDDTLDVIADQIERTLLTSQSWVRQFPVIGPIETEISYDSESNTRRGIAAIQISLTYPTSFQLVT